MADMEEPEEPAGADMEEPEEAAGQGFERVENQSAWNGTYYREDGEYITVYDTDEDYLFLSYPESNYEHMVDIFSLRMQKNPGSLRDTGYNGGLYPVGGCSLGGFWYGIYSIYAGRVLQKKRCLLLDDRDRRNRQVSG